MNNLLAGGRQKESFRDIRDYNTVGCWSFEAVFDYTCYSILGMQRPQGDGNCVMMPTEQTGHYRQRERQLLRLAESPVDASILPLRGREVRPDTAEH